MSCRATTAPRAPAADPLIRVLVVCALSSGCADNTPVVPRADAATEPADDTALGDASQDDGAQGTDASDDLPMEDILVPEEEFEDDVPPLVEDDDVACAVLYASPETAFDAGAGATPCVPGRATACRCMTGGAGMQTCDSHGRMGDCWCLDWPVVDPTSTDAGIVTYPDASTELPPRLVRPLSGMRVMSQRPTLRWVLPAGVTRARVELCEDRPCERRLVSAEVTETSWRPETPLRPGVVFWRVLGLRDDGRTIAWTSATWEFGVRHRDTPTDAVGGPLKDFDGDGYDDAVVNVGNPILILRGGRGGAHRIPEPMIQGSSVSYGVTQAVGDLDGDGLVDLAIGDADEVHTREFDGEEGYIRIFYGGRGCPVREGGTLRTPLYGVEWGTGNGLAIGDFNGDGFSDVISAGINVLHLYPGSAAGVARRPSSRIIVTGSVWFGFGFSTHLAGDVDGDGYPDVAVGNYGASGGDGQVQVFYGNSAGRLETRVQTIASPSGGEFGRRVMGADFDGDGFADLLVVGRGSILYYYRGSSRGLSLTPQVSEGGGTAPPGDIDGDGRLEMIWGRQIFRSPGEAGFASTPAVEIGCIDGLGCLGGALASPGDLDADGYDDLIMGTTEWIVLFRGGRLAVGAPRMSWQLGHPYAAAHIIE